MNYFILIVFTIISSTYLFAQPTLTNKSIPSVGEKYTYSNYDTVGVKQGNAGANVTWDFSKLKKLSGADKTINFEIVDPSNTSHADNFKDATYAYKQSIENTNNAYSYYKSSNDKIERLGTGFDDGAEILSDWELISKFPFTYQNSYTDKFIGKLDVMADGEKMTLNRGGEISVLADGYGTIILPNGTFNNVLRLKITQSIGDTIPPPVPGFPGGLMETITETYAWVSDDYKFALITISFLTSKTTFPGIPPQTVYSSDVTIYDFTPSGGETLSKPAIKSPSNGATKLSIPVTLEWNESILSKVNQKTDEIQGAIMYSVKVADNPEFSDVGTTLDFEVQETKVVVENLIGGTKYYWKVKANNGEVESQWSEVYNFTTKLPKPTAPTLNSPANGSKNLPITSLNLKWNANNVVAATRIMVTGPNNFNELVDNETSFELTNLTANSTYTWKVKFYNAEGDSSDWSEEWTFTTEPETSVDDEMLLNNIELNYNQIDNSLEINNLSLDNKIISIHLYDLNGNLILSNNYDSNLLRISLPNLSSGIYLVQVMFGNKVYSRAIAVGK